MKKETVIALALGITLGITIGLFLIFTAKEKSIGDKKIIAPPSVLSITPANFKNVTFEINEPLNNDIVNKNSVTIKGKSPKNSLLVFQSPTTEKVLTTKTEEFSVQFPLSMGENIIRVTMYTEKTQDEKTIKVYYFE